MLSLVCRIQKIRKMNIYVYSLEDIKIKLIHTRWARDGGRSKTGVWIKRYKTTAYEIDKTKGYILENRETVTA